MQLQPPRSARALRVLRRARLASCLFATAILPLACDDGGATSTGGATTTTGDGGGTTSASTSTADGGNGGSGGSTTSTGGSGGPGGSTTSAGGNGGNGGSTTGNGGNAGAGGTGGNGGSAGAGGTGGGGPPLGWGPPPPVQVPPLPPGPDYSTYPTDPQGRTIISQGGRINWVINNVPDAMTARERCADLVAHCFAPGVRGLDACLLSAPACASAEPWTESDACCASECKVSYSNLRKAGVDPLTAYQKVLYETPICMPGVDAMLAGGAP